MMDRYEEEQLELALNERAGWKFTECAKAVYLELARLQESKRIRLDQKFPMIVTAVNELLALWNNEEGNREKFMVPAALRDNYHFAKKRYQRMKGNPDTFYNEDSNRRAELEKEKAMLADKIRNFEVEYAREEDEKRQEVTSERIRLTSELAVLNYKKKKLEDKTESATAQCFARCDKKGVNKLEETTAKIKEIEGQLKKIGPLQTKSLDDKRYQLQLLHKRRWDIDKALNAQDSGAMTRLHRWQNAIDNAEVVMIVRRMDIDDAVSRHYSTFSKQLIHAFLNVYTLIKDCAMQAGEDAELIRDELKQLDELAELLSCPAISNRSVVTLFKKMQILQEVDRMQVIHEKPARNHLPIALTKTFSVKNFKETASSLGLYRKVIENPRVEESIGDAVSPKVKNN